MTEQSLPGTVIQPHRVTQPASLNLENLLAVEVRGRKVALLLAPDADRDRAALVCGDLTSRAITATVLAPRLSGLSGRDQDSDTRVGALAGAQMRAASAAGAAAEEAARLPASRPIGVACSTFYDGIVLLGECSPWLAADAHARTFVGDAYRRGKPVGVVAPSPEQTLATLAGLGHDVPRHEDPGIVVDAVVPEPRSADGDFTLHFLEALALHRFLGR